MACLLLPRPLCRQQSLEIRSPNYHRGSAKALGNLRAGIIKQQMKDELSVRGLSKGRRGLRKLLPTLVTGTFRLGNIQTQHITVCNVTKH